ncbi:GPP34 family phosphoprotein [Streptomyces sp. NPDC059385]|uniref:GOLPH3/VPS74 family protein n=1 Tax=Streptomyces sp. NPDC059385 TaxID=3346817 RepID=UPI0036B87CD9
MYTAQDLFIIALEAPTERPVGQGDLSLALAGAELIDLIGAEAVALDDDLILPAPQWAQADRLLEGAASALVRQEPYESVEDWLWRRGRDLSASYQSAFEEEGLLTRARRGRLSFGAEHVELVDTPARRRAQERREEDEPVLRALAGAIGIRPGPSEEAPGPGGEAVTTVLAAVHDAVMELEAVRQRKTIENAAFSNVWRAP